MVKAKRRDRYRCARKNAAVMRIAMMLIAAAKLKFVPVSPRNWL